MNLRKDHYRLAFSRPFSVNCIARWSRSPPGGGLSGSPVGESGNQRRAPPSPSPRSNIFLTTLPCCLVYEINKKLTTSNGGPLGSCIDEERSKLRYVV